MFFSKKNNFDQQSSSSNGSNEAITSILGKDMTVVGDVTFKGKARLDGRIEGNVKGEYLILSQTGNVRGDIQSGTIVCQGRVDGDVDCQNLYVKSGGVINGKIEATDLLVESGATLNGEVKAKSQDLRLVHGSPANSNETQQPTPGKTDKKQKTG